MTELITVRHERGDGWHRFTSDQVPGLYVVAKQDDLEEVYGELPIVLSALIKADFNTEVRITPQKPYSAYLRELPDSHLPGVQHFIIERLAA